MQQDAAGGMAQHAQLRAFERAQQPVGHLRGLHVHVAVHAADDQVEFGQRVVGQVHRAVFQDVALQAREDANAEAIVVELAHMRRRKLRRAFRPGRKSWPATWNDR